ncbi:MAG: MaoC/PaaZ C-terminal domain-containing protein [Acidimicrobiales bacterium]|jgi:acyl dehydratase
MTAGVHGRPKQVVGSVGDMIDLVGVPMGPSQWHVITQEHIDRFADAVGNPAANHTDPGWAARTPTGVTIAFGAQVLAMTTLLLGDLWELRGVVGGADCGSNKVRHLESVPVDSRVRLRPTIASAEPVGEGGVRVVTDLEFEMEGGTRPVCVAQVVNLFWFSPD